VASWRRIPPTSIGSAFTSGFPPFFAVALFAPAGFAGVAAAAATAPVAEALDAAADADVALALIEADATGRAATMRWSVADGCGVLLRCV